MAFRPTLQVAFLRYSLLGFDTPPLYHRLPLEVPGAIAQDAKPLRQSRRIVLMLAALFSLDAFAGGLIVQSLLALWLFERFGLSLATAGEIFFWTGVRGGGRSEDQTAGLQDLMRQSFRGYLCEKKKI